MEPPSREAERRLHKMKESGAKTVLVVEGDPTISRVCQRVLTGEGFTVDIAADGVQAQQMISEKEYDLILINFKTPVINGIELYKHILEKYPELADRVVFTNGKIPGVQAQAFLETCGRLFLPKPFTPDELKAVAREALRRLQK